jgi:hypothetical protein
MKICSLITGKNGDWLRVPLRDEVPVPVFLPMKISYLTIPVVLIILFLSCTTLAHYQQAKLIAPDANADDRFGVCVAIDGSTAVAGAYMADANGPDSGAAYVFNLVDSNWIHTQKLIASDASAGAQLGRSVAIAADIIVIGAPSDNGRGAVYVFRRSAGYWSQQQKLTAPDAASDDKFGFSVAVSGDCLVIGAYRDDNYKGSAYVFNFSGSIWTFLQKLTASDSSINDYFGWSVAIDNNTIIIGAYNDTHSDLPNAGSAFVFHRQDSTWIESAILHASDPNPGDHFGFSVALDDNMAAIGAYECDFNDVLDVGAAYVFTESGNVWSQQQKLLDDNPGPGEDFGKSVAVEKNTIFIGCDNDVIDGNRTGSVFEFLRTGSTWLPQHRLTAADANDEDNFGFSIAASNSNLIVGAHFSDPCGLSSGSAYLFDDVLAADLDGDSDVDSADLAIFASAWLSSPHDPAYDPHCDLAIPPDSQIDALDLQILCNSWLAGK